jgi:hypothetical protein
MRALKSAVALVVVLGAAACGPLKYEIKGTPQAVGADAVVTADVKKEQNFTLVEVKAKNLPPPERVMAGSTHFIAWQRKGSDGTWSRIGTLVYDEAGRTGALTATVPELRFDLEVTAEQQDAPASPSAEVVFFQKVGN